MQCALFENARVRPCVLMSEMYITNKPTYRAVEGSLSIAHRSIPYLNRCALVDELEQVVDRIGRTVIRKKEKSESESHIFNTEYVEMMLTLGICSCNSQSMGENKQTTNKKQVVSKVNCYLCHIFNKKHSGEQQYYPFCFTLM